jgi:hypothetical protein
MAGRAKPTLRCLREDLGQAVPPADTPLDEVPHPLLAKASERFADDGTPRERIASVDSATWRRSWPLPSRPLGAGAGIAGAVIGNTSGKCEGGNCGQARASP